MKLKDIIIVNTIKQTRKDLKVSYLIIHFRYRLNHEDHGNNSV